MDKTKQRTSTTEANHSFWERVRESAKAVQSGPSWMKAGITLNDAIFTTYPPVRAASKSANGTSVKK